MRSHSERGLELAQIGSEGLEPVSQLIDLAGYICPNGTCRTEQDGVTLRTDGFHYLGPGGQLVAKWLLAMTEKITPPA